MDDWICDVRFYCIFHPFLPWFKIISNIKNESTIQIKKDAIIASNKVKNNCFINVDRLSDIWLCSILVKSKYKNKINDNSRYKYVPVNKNPLFWMLIIILYIINKNNIEEIIDVARIKIILSYPRKSCVQPFLLKI